MITIEQKLINRRTNTTVWYPIKHYRTQRGADQFKNTYSYHFDILKDMRIVGEPEPRRTTATSAAGLVHVGDIFHSSYGYDMCINNFYEVTEVSASGKTCTIREIRKITVSGSSWSPEGAQVVPMTEGDDRYCGEPIKNKRVIKRTYGRRDHVSISLNSYESASKMNEADFANSYYECTWD